MNTVLVTTTHYESTGEMRFPLALRFVHEAKLLGNVDIIVVDSSPDPNVERLLQEAGATVYRQQQPGMGQARREALRQALERGYTFVCWIEPEKHTLIKYIPVLVEPLRNGDWDMVIPFRVSLESYPRYQAHSEQCANRELGNTIGRSDLDLMSGPRFMNRNAAEIMAAYDGKYGDEWHILFVPVLTMIRRGLRVLSVDVQYEHPVEQLTEDDDTMRKKRDLQREALVAAVKSAAADPQ